MKTLFLSLMLIALAFVPYQGSGRTNTAGKQTITGNPVGDTLALEKGYALMKQKCFICHMEKPDPAKRNQMIAPPMVRVQQHYKPAYPEREDFVKAVMRYVKNPSETATLMPGAVKKFHLMPKLVYTDAELRLIAEALYAYDFQAGSAQNSMMNRTLSLNDGKKWKLDTKTLEKMDAMSRKLNDFSSTQLSDYHQLGKEIFGLAKSVLLDTGHKGDAYTQLQYFFHGIEDNMHALMAAPSAKKAENQLSVLKEKFKMFHQYFY